jgi:hypothetical protein
METPTRVDLLLRRLKDNRFLSVLIVIGTIFVGLISFFGAIQKAGQLFGLGQSRATYDVNTKEAIIETAKKVDFLFLRIEAEKKEVFYSDIEQDFARIEADLRSILLRNELYPLNESAVKLAQLQLEHWDRVREKLKLGMSPSFAAHEREIESLMFRSQLFLEVNRRQ